MRRASWLVMGLVILVALLVDLQPDDTPRTSEDRIFALAETLKCPTCRSQSVADSEAPSAKAIRAEITCRRCETVTILRPWTWRNTNSSATPNSVGT